MFHTNRYKKLDHANFEELGILMVTDII